jgi:hypothetical protein
MPQLNTSFGVFASSSIILSVTIADAMLHMSKPDSASGTTKLRFMKFLLQIFPGIKKRSL